MQQKITYFTERNFTSIPQIQNLPENIIKDINVVAHVLPFRVNNYVLDELIDWNNIPEDPIFQLTFPQKGMLTKEHFDEVHDLIYQQQVDKETLKKAIARIRLSLNPHPAGQQEYNVPELNGEIVEGVQHKYRETMLFFPAQGQTCHSYCTFCFRWAQFIGDNDLKFKSSDAQQLKEYLLAHPDITDIIFTGGDPMVAKTKNLQPYFEMLLEPQLCHIQNIRIGSKALTYWPYRFTDDTDAKELLALFKRVVDSGKQLAFMAHFNHYREVFAKPTQDAIKQIQKTGAIIRSQAPILKHINNDHQVWETMWREQIRLGVIPYYMFVERDTGAKNYFEIPLKEAYEIYRNAVKNVSGLARTARGPSMSALPGKVEILGVEHLNGEDVFILRFLQGRNANWCYKPFFAKYDSKATWFAQLKPAFGATKFFFEKQIN